MRRVVGILAVLAVCLGTAWGGQVSPSKEDGLRPIALAQHGPAGGRGTDRWVPEGCGSPGYPTIQAAVAASVDGDTIHVCAGTYTEIGQIVIGKNLTIDGAGAATTIIKKNEDTGDPGSGNSRGWFLVQAGKSLTLSDVTLDGTGRKICIAILSFGTVTVQHCDIMHIVWEYNASYYGRGICTYAGTNLVHGCTFADIARIGVFVFGSGVSTAIEECTYTGKGVGDWLDYGFELGGGGGATISKCTVTGCKGVALVDGSTSAGVLITTYFGAGTTGTLTKNFLNANTEGLAVGYDTADTSTVVASNNDLSANLADALGNSSTTNTTDASGNWWGDNTPAGVAAEIWGAVDYTPWLDVGTDTSGDPGFQGNFSYLHVDDDSPQTGTTGRIQEGVNLVTASTVFLHNGTYSATTSNSTERPGYPGQWWFVTINKSLNLIGESRDGVIIDGTALQSQTRSTGIWVSASNVTIKNLTLQNFTQTPATYACYGMYVMEKFRDYTWGNVATLEYVTAENLKATGNMYPLYFMKTQHATIKDCISENSVSDGIWVAWGSHYATVQGNTVTNSGDHGIWVGASWFDSHGSDHATISDNYVDGAREGGISFVASDTATIAGNSITNVAGEDPPVGGWSVGALSLKDGPSNVTAYGNTIYNNSGTWGGHSGTGNGVGVDDGASPATNINLHHNSIYGNSGYACKRYSSSIVTAENNWWGSMDGPKDTDSGTNEVTLATCGSYTVAQMLNAVAEITGTLGDEVSDDVDYCPWLADPARIELNTADTCYKAGENVVTVTIDLRDATQVIVGGQFFLEYNKTVLGFVSISPGDAPFTNEIYEAVDQPNGLIDYAVGIPTGGTGTSADTKMAVITFNVLSQVCNGVDLVKFRTHVPPTRLSNDVGAPVLPALIGVPVITIDQTPPILQNPDNVTIECDEPDDPDAWNHKMHWPQLPDPNGWDIDVVFANLVADDWQCTETGPVLDIHFWYSWFHDIVDQIVTIRVNIYANVPDPDGEGPLFSMPGELKWQGYFWPGQFTIQPAGEGVQGFFDAGSGWHPHDHLKYYRCDITNIPDPFVQQKAVIYWLGISIWINNPVGAHIGWKTTDSGFMDTAVRMGEHGWEQLIYPGPPAEPLDMAFVITGGAPPPLVGHAYAHDNCDPDPLIEYTDVFTQQGGCSYTGYITRTWKATDDCGNVSTCLQTITINDVTPPVITCPADKSVNADAGLCTALVAVGTATATDNCDPAPVITGTRSDGQALNAPYPSGVTTITWKATDCSGNFSTCLQTITVSGFNELVVTVQLDAAFSGSRCITFELWDCGPPVYGPVQVKQVLNFVSGTATAQLVLVPCDLYTCITARDTLHTLRTTVTPTTLGTQYVASFTDTDKLLGGNLNDDYWIDILDFGVFSWKYGTNYGTGDTTCTTPFPHADISGDGLVSTPDFTFIGINFLKGNEANCCGQGGLRDGEEGPITRISVAELRQRGLGQLAIGDLNHDGWLDEQDIIAFLNGTMPDPDSVPTEVGPLQKEQTPASPIRRP